MNNVIGLKRATGKVEGERPLRVVIAAHADECGMYVRGFAPDGCIQLGEISGKQVESKLAQDVIIYGKEEVSGVIIPKEAKEVEDLLVDTGRSKEWVEERVSIGDIVVLAAKFRRINDKIVAARNFDDRLGTYCLIETAKRIEKARVDLYFVSTAQEEKGVRGMPVAASVIDPDVGLAIDGTGAGSAGTFHPHIRLGEGTGIYVIDRLSINSRSLLEFLFRICDESSVKYQKAYAGATDASAIQRTGSGALSTTVGAPTRYMHSPVSIAHIDDIDATAELLLTFCENVHKMPEASIDPWQEVTGS
jgi:endoglucanase